MIAYLHPRIAMTRTLTGRWATSGYPILGLPKHSEDGKKIRGLAKAPDWAWFYEIDYSQIDLRAATELSGDPVLVDAYRTGKDIHAITAHRVLGAPEDKKLQDKSKHRLPAKTVNFSILMGTTEYGLTESIKKAGNVEWTDEQSAALIDGWLSTYSGVRAWMEERKRHALATGFAYGMWGEQWYLPGVWSPNERTREETLRQTHALPVQSGPARLLKLAMAKIWKDDLPWAWDLERRVEPILQYHDALEFLVEKSFLMEWHQRVKATMESVASWNVPIIAEGSFGPSWAEQEEIG